MFEYRATQPAYDHTRERLWVEHMGEVRGREFSHMWHERRRIRIKYTELLVLYKHLVSAAREDRLKLNLFLGMVMDSFWRDILIGLCKFGDRSKGKKPLSLAFWAQRHMLDMPTTAHEELARKVQMFMTALKPIRELRNMRLAHADSEAILSAEPSGVSLEQVADAFEALNDCLDAIEHQFGVESIRELPYPSSLGGAESFIRMVNKGAAEHALPTTES